MSSGAALFVMGPAGSGKSTFCSALIQHCQEVGRVAHLINLDPAAETFEVSPSKDIRELIMVDEIMTEMNYGPNGGLMFALEFLLEHIEWLTEDLGQYQDEFLIIDCPGQIELYTHSEVMGKIIACFGSADYKCCALYLLESLFLQDISKYFAGVLTATSAMLQLAIPHINILSKMDLLEAAHGIDYDPEADDEDYREDTHPLHRYIYPDPALLHERISATTNAKFLALNEALVQLLDEFDMVNFVPFNINKQSSLENIMLHIESATQYGESLEPKDPDQVENY